MRTSIGCLILTGIAFQASTTSRKSLSVAAKFRQSESLCCCARAARGSGCVSQSLVAEFIASISPTGSIPAASIFIVVSDLAFIRRLPALTEIKVAGRHYVQEDSPDEIGRAIAGWMGSDPRQKSKKHSRAEVV